MVERWAFNSVTGDRYPVGTPNLKKETVMSNDEIRAIIVGVLNEYTTEMEGYSYFGSNPGVPEDVYNEVAEDIVNLLDV